MALGRQVLGLAFTATHNVAMSPDMAPGMEKPSRIGPPHFGFLLETAL